MVLHSSQICDESAVKTSGKSGCKATVNLNEAITDISKLQAAKAELPTIQFTDLLDDEKTTMVTSIVTETPPKNTPTSDICSAAAMAYVDFSSGIISNHFFL